MRIISIRVEPPARILAIIYAFFGLGYYLFAAFTHAQYVTLPFGVVAPLVLLNFNLNLARSGNLLWEMVLFCATVLAYTLSGWLTGALAALCFNLVAKRIGGIDATYVSTAEEHTTTPFA